MKDLLREPLLHFLLLGAGLFGAYALLADPVGAGEPDTIVITPGRIEHLTTAFARTWQRPPSAEELRGLIQDDVREEVYGREAMALGLDRDDVVIRRRLRQKLEFLTDDIAAQVEPTEEQLRSYLSEHAPKFRIAPSLAFSHVYLDPVRRPETLAHDAARLVAELNAAGETADISELGDPFLLERTFDPTPLDEIGRQFGDKFAARLDEIAPGRWQGPIESGFGVHLVVVTARTEGRLPAFEELREAVRRQWTDARRVESNQAFYEALLRKYVVIIDPGAPDAVVKQGAQEAR